jgi:hypothetical protein
MSLNPSSFYGCAKVSARDLKRKLDLSLAESRVAKKRVSDVLATSSNYSITKVPIQYMFLQLVNLKLFCSFLFWKD